MGPNLRRFRAVMEYGDFDHPPFFDEPVWEPTLRRWRREGLGEGVSWIDALDLRPELLRFAHHGFNHGAFPPFERRVLAESAEWVLSTDEYGRTVRNFRERMSMPEFVELPVRDRASFEAILPRFQGCWPQRVDDLPGRLARFAAADFDGLVVPPMGNYFFTLDALMGVETFAYMLADAPELIHRFFDGLCEMCCWFAREILPRTDAVFCLGDGEDLAYRNGPFFAPAVFEEFFVPRYRRVLAIARAQGVRHVFLDSDGDFRLLIPRLLELGIDIYCPCEVAAGMDPLELRRRFGREARIVGGVDKRIVAAGRQAITAELERLFPLMCEGGFVPKIDHSVSSDISWDSFRWYIDALRTLHARCARR